MEREKSERGVVPADVAEVMELFRSELDEVSFPDVDHEVLDGHAEEVEARAADVEHARAALDEARGKLEVAQTALRRAAERGLAYARVYADGDEALAERLRALALTRSATVEKKRRPRRKAKRLAAAADAEHDSRLTELPFPQ